MIIVFVDGTSLELPNYYKVDVHSLAPCFKIYPVGPVKRTDSEYLIPIMQVKEIIT